MIRHSGWKDIGDFQTWEGQSRAADEQAIKNFHRREQQLTRSQTVARRMFIGLMLLGTLGLMVARLLGLW